ncbi:MAG: DUF115 domain-containing protein [Methanomicrobium sp.]|nr:DUF115 domain-containing protein [Methanomicrobium sp.]MBQ4415061.1 DUF115 domain-containing protein [Methanomicrobium sp.]
MKFEEWEPHYKNILDFFGFDRTGDEDAAVLARSLTDKDDIAVLKDAVCGKKVTVCGNAPSLLEDMRLGRRIRRAGTESGKGEACSAPSPSGEVIFAADAAADRLFAKGIRPDIVSTDLDGCEDSFLEMNRAGTIMVVHAHGDNMPLLKSWIPRLEGPLVLTTQSRPIERVYNFGGFTDGDRAVFAADELGAAEITLAGFDLDDKDVVPMKHGKLMIARDLLALLDFRI